ncbi:MAG: serine/threonine-protein kinase, partial [Myxococcota bacterium]
MEVAPGKPPRFLGPYELLARIGTGGMAVVYLARRTGESGFSRLFALKVLHPHLGEDAEHLSMLLEEARVAARLHHVNVVPVVDLGHDRGFHYIVLDYVEGCSLVSLLRRSRDARPPRLVAAVVLDVLAGLHAAHTLEGDDGVPFQLVHRDVTPHNVLVAADGNAHLTDFGIVRIRAAGRAHETVAGQLKGKMHYLSPEQVRGDPIDRRSDIFSAGALLWSALTGRSLFRGENDGATLHNILEAPITPASRVGHRPPAELDEVMVRALERDPTARFATAREMDEALREALRPLGGPATRREVAEWVAARFGTELAERREAVRAVAERRASPPDDDLAAHMGIEGPLSSSLPAMDATLGSHSGTTPAGVAPDRAGDALAASQDLTTRVHDGARDEGEASAVPVATPPPPSSSSSAPMLVPSEPMAASGASEVVSSLRPVTDGRALPSSAPPPTEARRRRRGLAQLAFVAALLLTAGSVVGVVLTREGAGLARAGWARGLARAMSSLSPAVAPRPAAPVGVDTGEDAVAAEDTRRDDRVRPKASPPSPAADRRRARAP